MKIKKGPGYPPFALLTLDAVSGELAIALSPLDSVTSFTVDS